MKLRNPRRLFERKCDRCQLDLRSTYDQNRQEHVLCEKCYQEEVL
jgi:formylmethanofuran dehydrogenase subunit E